MALALAVVGLRAEQARCAARTLAAEARWHELRRELWAVQAEAARLRSPERIHTSVAFFETGLRPPQAGPAEAQFTSDQLTRPTNP